MSYVLKVEAIGDDMYQAINFYRKQVNTAINGVGDQMFEGFKRRYWVAEIKGLHPQFKFSREFLKGNKDYSQSNSVGSRGVYIYYVLQEGRIYEVQSPYSWRNNDRYFCTITNGKLVRLSEEEVKGLEWLKNNST